MGKITLFFLISLSLQASGTYFPPENLGIKLQKNKKLQFICLIQPQNPKCIKKPENKSVKRKMRQNENL